MMMRTTYACGCDSRSAFTPDGVASVTPRPGDVVAVQPDRTMTGFEGGEAGPKRMLLLAATVHV